MDQFRPQLAERDDGSALSSLARRARSGVVEFLKMAKSIGEDDPRRIIHSFKVGLALTLVSVFYYATPLFDSFGVSTMWAVLTVVVVMEYTVGGTLSKGLNRAFATLVAGALGVAAHEGAALCGEKGEPVLLALFVFLLAAAATFSRFIPEIKAKYDYGVTIFILTFCLVAVSSYRVDELLQLAHQRLSTVAIGVATCLATTIFVFPVWAGEDLHQLVAGNLEKLATFLQGLAAEYFAEKGAVENESVGKSFLKVPTSVLNSKAAEDSLANAARWEPCHGGFWFRHPWKQYLRIGALSRQCASTMDALAACAGAFPEHKPSGADPDLHFRIRAACREMSSESAEALRELSSAMRAMAAPASSARHVAVAAAAVAELRSVLSAADGVAAARDILHVATAASLLAEAVARTQAIEGAVVELARLARFKGCDDPVRDGRVKPDPEAGGPELDP